MFVAFPYSMKIILAVVLSLLTLLSSYFVDGREGPLDSARRLLNEGRYRDVLGILSSYRPSPEELSGYHYTLAKAFEMSKRFQDYMEQLRLAYIYSKEDEKPGLLLERAEAYMKIGYYSEASLIFKLFLKEFPASSNTTRAHIGLGESLYKLCQYEEAVNHFSKGGSEAVALYGLARSLQASGKTKEAYEAFKKALGKDRNLLMSSEENLYRYGENLLMMKRYDEAKTYLNSIKEERLKARAGLLLGIASSEERRYEEALRYLEGALSKGDRDTKRRSLYHIARVYIETGRKKEAEKRLLDLRLHYPFGEVFDKATLSLSRLYRESGEKERAISLLKELIFRRSPDREAIDEIESIILSVMKGDKEELLRLWNSVGHWLLEPSRSGILLKVAEALRGTGTAFLRLTTWLVRHGDNESKKKANLLLAEFYAHLGETGRAEDHLRLSGEKGGKGDDLFRVKARLSLYKKDLRGAVDSILSIREFNSEDLHLLLETLYLMKKERPEESRRLIDRFRRLIDKGNMGDYIELADLLYELKLKDEALSYYRKAVGQKAQDPDDLDWAYYRISRITMEGEVISMIKGGRLKRLGEALSKELEIEKALREVL